MNNAEQKIYNKFLEHKDEMIESLTEDIAKLFKEHPESIWNFFTPVHEAAEQIRANEKIKAMGGVVTDE